MNIAKANSWRCPDLLSGAQTSGSVVGFNPNQPGKESLVRSGVQCPVQWRNPSLRGGHSTARRRKRSRILRRPWNWMRTWSIVTDCWGLLRDEWTSSKCGSHDLISPGALMAWCCVLSSLHCTPVGGNSREQEKQWSSFNWRGRALERLTAICSHPWNWLMRRRYRLWLIDWSSRSQEREIVPNGSNVFKGSLFHWYQIKY